MENWKKIKGYPYMVSDLGRVKSLHKYKGVAGTIKKPVMHKNGYMQTMLHKRDGTFKLRLVHRLVMEAFRPTRKKMQVNHINLNKADNRFENLCWCTSYENMQHAARHGRLHTPGHVANRKKLSGLKGESNYMATLTEKEVLEIRQMRGIPYSAIAEAYGLTVSGVSSVMNRFTWKHLRP